jgi:putative transposase
MRPHKRWRMDFVGEQSVDGRLVRVLMIVDQSTRECLAETVDRVVAQRGTPDSIMVDNAPEFRSKTLAFWACRNGVYLSFFRPGRPWWKGGSYADRHGVT